MNDLLWRFAEFCAEEVREDYDSKPPTAEEAWKHCRGLVSMEADGEGDGDPIDFAEFDGLPNLMPVDFPALYQKALAE